MTDIQEKPKAISLTDRAADQVKAIMARSEDNITGLRLGMKKGGCAGMEHVMEYASAAEPLDEVVEDKGVTIYIDSRAFLFLLGTEMDYVTEKLSSQFVFNNPNQTSACGCGESVEITPMSAGAIENFSKNI